MGTITPNSDAHPQNVGKINVGFVTARSIAGDIDANTLVVAGISTFVEDVTFDGATAGRDIVFDRSNNHLKFKNNAKISLGDGDNANLYYDGSNPILFGGTGTLRIVSDNIHLEAGDFGDEFLRCTHDGGVALYYDNSLKFTTASNGAVVTGSLGVDELYMGDNEQIKIGAEDDFLIYHGGSENILDGVLHKIELRHGSEKHLVANPDGAVQLYYDNGIKFATLTNGVQITGQSYISEGTINLEKATVHHHRILSNDTGNDLAFQQSSDTGSNTNFTTYLRIKDGGDIALPVDNQKLRIGAGEDLRLYHDGSSSYITNTTGNLYIESKAGETAIQIIPDGAVDLRHNGIKKLETAAEGGVIPSGGGNCLRVFGQNTAHATSALIIGQNNTTTSQLRAYGPDGSTNGRIEFRSSRSDATNTINLIYDSGNLQFASGHGLDFSATGGASGVANHLFDDYEEGTFSFNESNISVSNFEAKYTKIGRVVMCSARLNFGTSSNTSTLNLTGLPFTPDSGAGNSTCGGVVPEQNLGLGALFMAVEHGNVTVRIRKDNGQVINPSNASGKTLRFVLHYIAA